MRERNRARANYKWRKGGMKCLRLRDGKKRKESERNRARAKEKSRTEGVVCQRETEKNVKDELMK